MSVPLFLVSLALFAFAFSMIFAPIVWDIIREMFGAALIMLAIVLLAIAGLVSMAHAREPNNVGLPAEIVEQVKARCAELFPFYDSQVGCIEMEAKACQKLQEK